MDTRVSSTSASSSLIRASGDSAITRSVHTSGATCTDTCLHHPMRMHIRHISLQVSASFRASCFRNIAMSAAPSLAHVLEIDFACRSSPGALRQSHHTSARTGITTFITSPLSVAASQFGRQRGCRHFPTVTSLRGRVPRNTSKLAMPFLLYWPARLRRRYPRWSLEWTGYPNSTEAGTCRGFAPQIPARR